MNKPTTTRLRLSAEQRRKLIVETAAKLFADKGFRGTTTRELAAAVGVTEPVLYEHFKTKSDLYGAILDAKSCEKMDHFVAVANEFAGKEDDRGFFVNLARMIVQFYTSDDHTMLRLLLYSNLEGHELKDLFSERATRFFGVVVDYVARRMKDGALRRMDPEVAARTFFGMVGHYAMTALAFGTWRLTSQKDTEVVISEMVEIYLGGMCNEETR